KTKFGMSMPKRKEPGTENTKPGSDVPHSVLETTADTSSEDGRHLDVKPQLPDEESEVSTWKIQMPSFKMAKTPKADMKTPREESTVESLDTVKKAQTEEDGMPMTDKSLKMDMGMKAGEKEIEGKESKFRLPKFKLPTFTWATTKDETGQNESQVSDREGKGPSLERGAKTYMSESEEQMKITNAEIEIGISKGKINEKDGRKLTEVQLPSLKHLTAKKSSMENHLEETEVEILITKPDIEIQKDELSISSKKTEEMAKTMMAAGEGPALGLKADIPGTKTEGAGWKVEKPSLKMPKADIKAPKVDISLPSVDVTLPKASVDLQAPEAALTLEGEAKAPEKEAAKTKDGKFKMPKFGMPSFGWSSSREAKGTVAADVDVSLKEPQVTVPSGTAEVDVTLPAAEIQVPTFEVFIDSPCGKDDEMGKSKSSLFRMPKVSLSKSVKVDKPSCEIVLDAPNLDVSLPSMEATMPKLEVEIHGPDLECKVDQEVVSGEKDTEEKENKFKTSKFKLPSFSWSPKKEAIAPSEVEGHLEEPTLSTLPGDTESELTFPTPENQYLHGEFDISTEKDGEKGRNKKSQFTMPKISFPKIKGQKVQVSLPILETDICGPKQEKEGVSVQKSEKGSSGEGAGMGIKMPKVTVPTLEFSKPEVKAPKIDMDVKSPDTSVEKTSNEIAVGDIEIKIEGPEGKTKMSEFQMPKFGIIHSKGKGSEKEVSQSKSEVNVPQLKAMVEITDIAVEGPNLEVECGTGTETYSPKVKMTKADNKASEADVHFPSADISIPKTDSDIQDSDAALKIKGEIKQDGDGEEKEGHFKMPKFKLPSFSWSPKKEASVKPDSGANLEDHKLAVMSSRIDTEVRGTAADYQGTGPALDLEISVEQKSPVKKPQFVMPKISLSKIKVPKSQTHSPKAEADATILKTEREGDGSIQTPDIERSHSERTEEGAQISIKLADVDIPTLEFSKIETGASQTEMGVSSAKIDAVLPPSEGSFQQVVLKSSSTNEDTIQKTGIKFPRGEASTELRSPEIVTERSSVVDGRKMKLEGPEGKTKMPKFQKPKFGISLTKGKVPEAEISSPKIEAELPQLKMTNEIADIAVGVPASELTSDMSDPGVEVWIPKLGDSVKSSDVSLSKIEGDTSLSTERTDSRVNIPKTETYADIVKHGAEGQKMHTSEFTVSSAELSKSYLSTSEIDKDNSLTNRFPTITVETVDKSQAGPELNIKIPKLKIPRFTFKALPTEIDVSVSKVVTDPKGSSTDIEV
ncbi:Neuroblast differentiation-associated protein AHNAK, partial [Eudyptula minor]